MIEANNFLRSLLDGMAEGVCTTDEEGRFTYVNPAVCETLGYSASELHRMKVLDVIDPGEVEKIKHMKKRRRAGKVDRYELEVICKDGAKKTVLQTVTPLRRDGAVIGGIAVVTDITERHLMEAALTERNRHLTLLQSFTARGISRLTTGKIKDDLAQEVAAAMGYEYCSIFLLSADSKRLELVARNERRGEDFEALNQSGIHDLANQQFVMTPVAQAFLSGAQVVVEDISKFEGFDRVHEVARLLGSSSLAAMPLVFQGVPLGAMVVQTREPHTFAKDELDFLRAIADQVSIIAGNANIYRNLERSEERYRELYDSAADWMYSLAEDGTILDCNSTMVEALARPKNEIVGKRIYDFETVADSNRAQGEIEETRDKGIFAAERHFIGGQGDRFTVDVRARLFTDEKDNRWWEAIGRDVTEKIETQRRIDLLVAAVENTRDCVVVSDLNGDILSINEAGALLYGFPREEMIGMHMGEIWSAENSPELREEIFSASLSQGGWEGQMWIRNKDGASLPVFASSARVADGSGQPIALVGIIRDLSQEQRMTEEILRRNRELAVLNAVASTTAGSRDVTSMLQNSLQVVIDAMGYDAGMVYLADRKGVTLKPAAATFPIPDYMKKMVSRLPAGTGHGGAILASGEPVFVEDYMNSQYRLAQMPGDTPIVSLGGVPLISKEKVLGVLSVSTGQPHDFSAHERALLTAVGKSIGIALENARLFDDIASAKSQWESTFDAMTNGVSIHDRDYRILRANQALASMLNTTTSEMVGKKCYEVFHGLPAPPAACPLQGTIRNGEHTLVTLEEPYLNRILSLSADPYYDDQGNIIGCIHDVRDITEQEKMRKQLAQSEKLRALGEMAGGVAHDFNNFLTVILGNTQLLLANRHFDMDTVDALETIQRASADAAETVRRIQEFTRVRTVRSFTTVDINLAIANAIEVSRPRWRNEAESRGVRIHMDVHLDPVPSVRGNATELGEVFLNLILNAADALTDGGTIRVRSGVNDAGMAQITIADDGKGMPQEVRQRIFEPFYSTKGPKGSGLGLSLTYGIISRHGGDVTAQSQEGKGSTFKVVLPLAQQDASLPAGGSCALKPDGAKDADQQENPASVGPGRVLVIEDEGSIRTLLADIVGQMGHETATASTGREGVEQFQRALEASVAASHEDCDGGTETCRAFDLVLTDLGMPGMSGWEVVQRIKDISPGTPVALITGWGDQLDPAKMKTSCVDMIMAKPFSVSEVKKLVAEALAGKR